MAPSSEQKGRKSIRLTPGKQKQLLRALDALEEHYHDLAKVWTDLTPEQREQVLAHSPVLARWVELARPFTEVL